MRNIYQVIFPLSSIVFLFMAACSGPVQQNRNATPTNQGAAERLAVPDFNKDSAYAFVQKQVSFGPRVPNTPAHQQAGDWMQETLEGLADTVYVQQARLRAYDGTLLNMRNIIGVFQPQNPSRILLCAHWDSRPFADHDPDAANHFTPIDGANDGASGVGVLLEIARILSQQQPHVGVDIILFDAEDYGKHEQHRGNNQDSWALGSQYWAKSPHLPNYNARYGILLDMVGDSAAVFKQEGFSIMYARNVVRNVWSTAIANGYDDYFVNQQGGYITDDHYYINELRNIPTINIIHQDNNTPHGFFPQWHTIDDTIDHIDSNTLKAVGQTVLAVIFGEK